MFTKLNVQFFSQTGRINGVRNDYHVAYGYEKDCLNGQIYYSIGKKTTIYVAYFTVVSKLSG